MSGTHFLHSRRIGLALGGGSVRGLAHIGVIKALTDSGIQPSIITGTSAGSLIGAGLAAGLNWRELAEIARSVFWPSLLHTKTIESFCAKHFPETFQQLRLPFAAVATSWRAKEVVVITRGRIDSAISASCAMRVVRRSVLREGQRLKDGGISCVLPARACRDMGAEFVIASDVWEISSVLRGMGLEPTQKGSRAYPSHYRLAIAQTDLLIQPFVPRRGYMPGRSAVDHMIAAGERAALRALANLRIESDPTGV